ncbi:serum amyloid A protein-like isoform X2 [Suncus etruscus]|uniref:serum amyloid A protein-like isoform X2 n=1 Tax=Suncus etruscus TaxID=109475 RepID=UPI00211060EC|nr:serum amyloid A protein-like isoform X2 [Suncus etruscus]
MKLSTAILFCSLFLGVSSQSWFSFIGEAFEGAKDMWNAYSDMREANYKNSDKYFHARGNYEAAQRGPGGVWAAKVISKMKLFTAILFCSLFLGVSSQRWLTFLREASQGAGDMWRAYSDMREANHKNSDKYFHARGNYDAARRGPGGAWAAKVISDAREGSQRITDFFKYGNSGHGREDSKADQFANEWGRSGKDPNHFRPAKLPEKY